MGYQNREIEMKFLVEGASSLREVESVLLDIFSNKNVEKIEGSSKDVYWKPVEQSSCDFVRVRHAASKDDLAQMTIKKKDRGSILNRVEIDVNVDSADNSVKLLNYVLGKPLGEVSKTYSILFLNKLEENVSIYQVTGDSRIFLEVEARTGDKVRSFEKHLKKGLQDHSLNLKRVYKSLFEIFIKRESEDEC